MVKMEVKEDVAPVCPHCNKEIATMWLREIASVFGRRYVYFCSSCRKVLGVSQRKGFWMG